MPRDIAVVRRLFAAAEQRALDRVLACYSDDVEIAEAGSLPYGGVWRGRDGAIAHAESFMRTWSSFQGPAEVRLDARFWSDGTGSVCAVFRHRAVDTITRARVDSPEVGIYCVRDDRIVSSQMFHADSAALLDFLATAGMSARS